MKLRLAPGLEFPEEAVTQTFGILAKRGAGKSNTAAVMAEEMFKAELPFVVVDPVGAWWGLRSSADGKGPGLSIPIFGGYRGDVPLERGGAELVADLIVDQSLSCVVDVSAFESETAKREFLATFAERLFRRKGQPGRDAPLHLFLEEADDYAPQRATGAIARCLGAFQRIVKQGRARGLGATMISQRSAALNKDLLTQIETLIVLRTTGPRDIHAIGEWVKYHGQAEKLLASLHELAPGEAWVWSPWLELTKRAQIRRRATFDSGATPKAGAKKAATTLADVDLEALRVEMAETIERAKATDPKELQKRVRELEHELSDKGKASVTVDPVIEQVEIPVIAPQVDKALRALSNGMVERIEWIGAELRQSGDALIEVSRDIRKQVGGVLDLHLPVRPIETAAAPSRTPVRTMERPKIVAPTLVPEGDVPLGKGEKTVLGVLRQWPKGRTYNELAFLAGYSAKASTLGVILSNLRRVGYVEPGNQPVRLTAVGLEAAGGYEPLPTGDALLRHWLGHPRMGKGERDVLQVLVEQYPKDLTHDELCQLTGYSPIASTMGVIVSKLRKLGLVEKNARRLAPEFAEAIGR